MNYNELLKSTLQSMLREPVATSILDSGDHYGRHFEANQNVSFDDLPMLGDCTYGPVVNTYPYLLSLLELDDVAIAVNAVLEQEGTGYCQEIFKDSKATPRRRTRGWGSRGYEDGEVLRGPVKKVFKKAFDYRAEDIKVFETVNTYNGECFLDQTLQYKVFSFFGDEDKVYIALQIHGGCDVRGGYTDTKIFKLTGYLDHTPEVFGYIEDRTVSTVYNGYSLTFDDTEEEVDMDDAVGLELHVNIDGLNDMLYVYTD